MIRFFAWLTLSAARVRLKLACVALRVNNPLIADLLFKLKYLKPNDQFIPESCCHPSDIRDNQRLLLSRALDSPEKEQTDGRSSCDRSEINFLCLISNTIYGGKGESPVFSSLAQASKSAKYHTFMLQLETPTIIIDKLINEQRVTHIFLWASSEHSERIIRYLASLRNSSDIKVSVLLPDPHSYESFDEFLRYEKIADSIYAGATWMPAVNASRFLERVRYRTFAPFVIPSEIKSLKQRDISISFSGIEKVGRLPILILLSKLCKKYRILCSINLKTIARSVEAAALSDYYDVISRSVAIINISVRVRNDFEIFDVINSRVFEALAFKCVLIEYKPPQISSLCIEAYFTAGEHFLTFSNRSELECIILRLANNDPSLVEVAERGHLAYRNLFGKINLVDELVEDFCKN